MDNPVLTKHSISINNNQQQSSSSSSLTSISTSVSSVVSTSPTSVAYNHDSDFIYARSRPTKRKFKVKEYEKHAWKRFEWSLASAALVPNGLVQIRSIYLLLIGYENSYITRICGFPSPRHSPKKFIQNPRGGQQQKNYMRWNNCNNQYNKLFGGLTPTHYIDLLKPHVRYANDCLQIHSSLPTRIPTWACNILIPPNSSLGFISIQDLGKWQITIQRVGA